MQQINLKEIETAINQYGKIVVSKNSKNELVVTSMEEYKKEMLKEEIINALKKSEQEIENGEGIEADEAFEKLRQKYGYEV